MNIILFKSISMDNVPQLTWVILYTGRGLHGWRPGHSDRAGKGMRLQVGETCVKDTKEEDIWTRGRLGKFQQEKTSHSIDPYLGNVYGVISEFMTCSPCHQWRPCVVRWVRKGARESPQTMLVVSYSVWSPACVVQWLGASQRVCYPLPAKTQELGTFTRLIL